MSQETQETQELLFAIKEEVAFISLNRPCKKNALNRTILRGIVECLDKIEKNQEVKAVIISSTSPEIFSAGADLSGMTDKKQIEESVLDYTNVVKRLHNFHRPVIAVVRGLCIGGGLGLALSCEIVLAAKTAVFRTPETRIGLYPLIISPLIYRNCNSRKRADEFIITGRKVCADEAFELGMISAVVNDHELEKRSEEFITLIKNSNPAVLNFGRATTNEAMSLPFNECIDKLGSKFAELLALPGTQERICSFLTNK